MSIEDEFNIYLNINNINLRNCRPQKRGKGGRIHENYKKNMRKLQAFQETRDGPLEAAKIIAELVN